MRHLFASLVLLSAIPAAHAAQDCANLTAAPKSSRSLSAPLSPEFASINGKLGAPTGVLANSYDQAESVDGVLQRKRVEACKQVAAADPKPTTAPATIDPNTYKPKTAHDNTPYRFSMTQNGKKMTADDFDAWLKATGYSAGRRAEATAKPAEPPVAEPAPADTKKANKK